MTKYLIAPRGGGKTAAAVDFTRTSGGLLVVANDREATRIRGSSGLGSSQVCTIHKATPALLAGRPVAVDNADLIIEAFLGARISLMTLTSDAPNDDVEDLTEQLAFEQFRQLAIAKASLRTRTNGS